MQEKIEIEYQNIIHAGHYSVAGVNKKQVVVYYNGRKRVADFDYRAEQPGYVESLAKQMLMEMLEEEFAEGSQETEAEVE
jgi:hypothetical protein